MHERGYFAGAPAQFDAFKKTADKWLSRFLRDAGVRETAPAYARSTAHYRVTKEIQPGAFIAWQARVLQKARRRPAAAYRHGVVDFEFMGHVAALSVLNDAPLLVCQFLEKHGIRVVTEPHLSRTYLDGAALLDAKGRPIIGLTLRHDRLDNFWFTLLHELAHVGWHLGGDQNVFFDALDAPAETDTQEAEADRIAGEALIPPAHWRHAGARRNPKPAAVRAFAQDIHRHPAIVAGRIRRDNGNYKILNNLVGRGLVRRLFEV